MFIVEKVAILLLIVIGTAIVAESAGAGEEHINPAYKAVSLKEVCYNQQVPIISVSEVRRMISELYENPELCPESFRQSIYELGPLLSLSKGERVCNERKFEQIKEYHFRYVNPKVENYEFGQQLDRLEKVIKNRPLTEEKTDYTVQLDRFNQEIMIPIALQQFFKAWALQVTGLCKKALVENLKQALQENLNDEDIELIDMVISSPKEMKDPISKVPLSKLYFSDLIFMPELDGFKNEEEEAFHKGITTLDLRQNREADRFMHGCIHRFKPIYDKLIIPVVRMAKLGYDYLGSKIASINKEFEKCPDIRRWLALTSICEARGKVQLIENEENPIVMEDIEYEPVISFNVDDDLWIKGAEQLRKEFNIIKGSRSTGLKRVLYKMGKAGRVAVAAIDPHQFAWYRRNQNTISSVLNSLSISSNAFSIGLTIAAGRR